MCVCVCVCVCMCVIKTQLQQKKNKANENETMEEKQEFERCLTLIRQKTTLTINDIQTAGNKINNLKNSVKKKKIMAEELRKRLFDYYYPLPNKCRKIVWFLVLTWSILATFLVIVYGINFDVITEYRNTTLDFAKLGAKNIDQTCWQTDLITVIQNSYNFFFFFCVLCFLCFVVF